MVMLDFICKVSTEPKTKTSENSKWKYMSPLGMEPPTLVYTWLSG